MTASIRGGFSDMSRRYAQIDDEPEAIRDELIEEVVIPQRAQGRYLYRAVKRVFDIVFSLCATAVLLIPGLILCLIIRIDSPGSPIYVQRRVGKITKDGKLRTFPMLKFRSMCKDADSMLDGLKDKNEADGPLFKMKDDPRITKIGHYIRKHSIDEMPQFINVLLGQLTVVGPRPPLPEEVERYTSKDMKRLTIKPGLTGYWQIRNSDDFDFHDMVDLDLKYIEDRSWWTDIKLICKTAVLVFKGGGASC